MDRVSGQTLPNFAIGIRVSFLEYTLCSVLFEAKLSSYVRCKSVLNTV
jgi:hypothetical protein